MPRKRFLIRLLLCGFLAGMTCGVAISIVYGSSRYILVDGLQIGIFGAIIGLVIGFAKDIKAGLASRKEKREGEEKETDKG